MIQFNLLPDVKLQYIRARRLKQTMITVSGVVIIASLAVTIFLFMAVQVFQKEHISHINKDIKESTDKLQGTKDLDKLLTIQNQLSSLSSLHDSKKVGSRTFGYLAQVTPKDVTISNLEVDFDAGTMKITGGAKELSAANQYVDTLKFTTYTYPETKPDGGTENKTGNAFTNVVLSSWSRNDKETTYTIDLRFDPAIFDVQKQTSLVVPNQITTRSSTEKPSSDSDIFKQPQTNNPKQ